jgi:OmcA/MtrC family decaheme c-type cytochrome
MKTNDRRAGWKRNRLGHGAWLLVLLLLAMLAPGCSDDGDDIFVQGGPEGPQGPEGPAGPPGPPGDSGFDPITAVEACVGCHGEGAVVPVGDITDMMDAHYVDTDPDGPAVEPWDYRQLNIEITEVDLTGANVEIDFEVTDENGSFVPNLFASDGRFTIARLTPGTNGDASIWTSLITRMDDGAVQANSERFTSGTFAFIAGGSYTYSSRFLQADAPIANDDTMRVAIQLSAGDLPAGNGWCDFDADLTAVNDDCDSATESRDIVQTDVCNGCHGVTSDVHLALHGGGRTQIEYCVTCHNPGSTDGQSLNTVDMKVMIHKIHRGADLTNLPYQIVGFRNSVHDYSFVNFTKDIDDCTTCHTGGGAQEDNWFDVPTMEACGSCHDDVNFATGENHPPPGGAQPDNSACSLCHGTGGIHPVQTVHQGVERALEGGLYAGIGNGYEIVDLSYDSAGPRELTIDYSVTRDGTPMTLETDPEWNAGGGASRLALDVGWNTEDYDNDGSGNSPALPLGVNALDVGGAVQPVPPGNGVYRAVVTLPSSATSGTVTVALEGHPAADLDGDDIFSDRIAVKNAFDSLDLAGGREMTVFRRNVVDIDKCNACHDSAGNGISLHGNNRTGEDQVCVLCHTANTTDINRRPDPPTADGKDEETIDFKRMIHQIHTGAELEDGLFIYGFGGSLHDFSHVEFIGNRQNCETCHLPGTYSTEDTHNGLPTTIDTGDDADDPDDDLNISQTASVCSACHDHTPAKDHMKLHGASFKALDEDIH